MDDYHFFSDAKLTALLKAGDQLAYEEIYNRYRFILHNHAWNKIRNKQEAQDALQEVFTLLWTKRETLNIGDNLSGFLYSCVRNHLLNIMTRKEVQSKYLVFLQNFSEHDQVTTDYRARENQLKELIQKEIDELPPRIREVFELSRKHHLTHREIAAMLGTSEETVKKQVNKALRKLRMRLGIIVYLLYWFNAL